MNTKILKALILLYLPAILISCSLFNQKPDDNVKNISSKDLKETAVILHSQEVIRGNKNYIYCATFELAWNEAIAKLNDGKKIILDKQSKLADLLNKQTFKKSDIDQNDVYVNSGLLEKGIIDIINKDLQNKFQNPILCESSQNTKNRFLIYSYLEKNMKFEPSFEGNHKIKFKNSTVKAFGFKDNSGNKDMRKNVTHYFNHNEPSYQIITIKTDKGNEELILSDIPLDRTLLDTYNSTIAIMKNSDKYDIDSEGTLLIPKIAFNVSHDAKEIIGLKIVNNKYNWQIEESNQITQFIVNEHGVKLKSRVKISFAKGGASRHIIFDKPFMLILKQKNSDKPYFMLWIDNEELLQKI